MEDIFVLEEKILKYIRCEMLRWGERERERQREREKEREITDKREVQVNGEKC